MEKQLENKDYCKKYRQKNRETYREKDADRKRTARLTLKALETESPRKKSTTRSRTTIETLSTSQANGNGQRKKRRSKWLKKPVPIILKTVLRQNSIGVEV